MAFFPKDLRGWLRYFLVTLIASTVGLGAFSGSVVSLSLGGWYDHAVPAYIASLAVLTAYSLVLVFFQRRLGLIGFAGALVEGLLMPFSTVIIER